MFLLALTLLTINGRVTSINGSVPSAESLEAEELPVGRKLVMTSMWNSAKAILDDIEAQS